MVCPRASTSFFAARASFSRAAGGPLNVTDCFAPPRLPPSSHEIRTDSPRCSGEDAMRQNLTPSVTPWGHQKERKADRRSHLPLNVQGAGQALRRNGRSTASLPVLVPDETSL